MIIPTQLTIIIEYLNYLVFILVLLSGFLSKKSH